MRKSFCCLLFVFFWFGVLRNLVAQSPIQEVVLTSPQVEKEGSKYFLKGISPPLNILENSRLFARVEIKNTVSIRDNRMLLAFKNEDGNLDKLTLGIDIHAFEHDDDDSQPPSIVSNLFEWPSTSKLSEISFYVEGDNTLSVDDMGIKIYEDIDIGTEGYSMTSGCICPPILYKSREQWKCPDGADSPLWPAVESPSKTFVIHHQAGTANPPYDAVVRGIWNFHTYSNGWGDIGYNWLIAPDGTIFQGRAWVGNQLEQVKGGHMCSCNSNKIGICLLGDLTNEGPTHAAYQSLIQLIGDKACIFGIDTDTLDLTPLRMPDPCVDRWAPTIIGHKHGCPIGYTECPGNAFEPKMDSLRTSVRLYLKSCASATTMADYDEFQIHPNPIIDVLKIEGPQRWRGLLEIFNIFGQKLFGKFISLEDESLEISTIEWPSGMYYILCKDSRYGQTTFVRSIVKQ